MTPISRRMHQTTVRFGTDLWEQIEREAAGAGVSTAQFIREAALARVAYTAGRRGDPEFEAALAHAGIPVAAASARARTRLLENAARELDSSAAVWSQAEMTRRRARDLREVAAALRRERSLG